MRRSNHTHAPTRQRRCAEAESYVAEALRRQGWRILCRNYRHIGFELDVVAAKANTLIVVEVKARMRRPDSEREFSQLLPRKKREALLRGATAIGSRLQCNFDTLRIDLAIVYSNDQGRSCIDYHVNALPDH